MVRCDRRAVLPRCSDRFLGAVSGCDWAATLQIMRRRKLALISDETRRQLAREICEFAERAFRRGFQHGTVFDLTAEDAYNFRFRTPYDDIAYEPNTPRRDSLIYRHEMQASEDQERIPLLAEILRRESVRLASEANPTSEHPSASCSRED